MAKAQVVEETTAEEKAILEKMKEKAAASHADGKIDTLPELSEVGEKNVKPGIAVMIIKTRQLGHVVGMELGPEHDDLGMSSNDKASGKTVYRVRRDDMGGALTGTFTKDELRVM
jgi:hypothetical protein